MRLSASLLRLPMWLGLQEHQPRILDAIAAFFERRNH